MDEKVRVGVIRGGSGGEYNTSIEAGSYVVANIPSKYKVLDFLVTRDGVWHKNGMPFDPENLKDEVDIVFIMMYGEEGESGRLQRILDEQDIPYIGSSPEIYEITGHKPTTKERLKQYGFNTPRYLVLQDLKYLDDDNERDEYVHRKAQEIFKKIPPPWVIKPILGSASTYVYLVTTYKDLLSTLDYLSDKFDELLVEEFVHGREIVSGVINGLRGQDHYVFPPHEVVKPGKILDSDSRGSLNYSIRSLGRDLEDMKDEIQNLVKSLHDDFGMNDFSSVDLVITPQKKVFVIEIDSTPILGEGHAYTEMIRNMGINDSEVLDHLIQRNLK